jgi:hypothetical protein
MARKQVGFPRRRSALREIYRAGFGAPLGGSSLTEYFGGAARRREVTAWIWKAALGFVNVGGYSGRLAPLDSRWALRGVGRQPLGFGRGVLGLEYRLGLLTMEVILIASLGYPVGRGCFALREVTARIWERCPGWDYRLGLLTWRLYRLPRFVRLPD